MKTVLSFCLVAGLVLACAAPDPSAQANKHKPVPVTLHQQSMKRLKPTCEHAAEPCKGRYAYQNKTVWYYYAFSLGDISIDVNSADPYESYRSTLPPGGTWSSSKVPPELDEELDEEPVDVEESVTGAPDGDDDAAADGEGDGAGDGDGGGGGGDGGGGDGGGGGD